MSLPEGSEFNINGKAFNFAVVSSALDLIKGLAHVDTMAPLDGMLFDFGFNFQVAMTPKGLRFPVDVAFITEAGEVKRITTLNPAFPFPEEAPCPVRYALEVPVNFFTENNISVGDTIDL